ncbi:MAG TPA: hypothetical protein VMX17_06615 [Candidatus Glassbacteria bacterium]|nr:hypothetical protein [Candidatus Glassbacteria bacterium]
MKNILKDLTIKQRALMCFWGTDRRYKYFDLLEEGMAQRFAWEKARKFKPRKNKENGRDA